MADATFFYDELRFDTRDPAFTHVYCFIRGEGDCPFFVHGWHHKVFPSQITTQELFDRIWTGQESPLSWDREPPQAVLTPAIYNPHDRVPVPVEQLQAWRTLLATLTSDEAHEMAEQITSHLCAVTQWEKVCPHCRAHDMMLQAQRNPQG